MVGRIILPRGVIGYSGGRSSVITVTPRGVCGSLHSTELETGGGVMHVSSIVKDRVGNGGKQSDSFLL